MFEKSASVYCGNLETSLQVSVFDLCDKGSTYSVLHIVAYSPIFKDFVSHIKCATYCVLHFFNVI